MVRHYYRFKVTGHGDFPTDMLRYDQAWPRDMESAHRMLNGTGRYTVELNSILFPTVARWESFGWTVEMVED